MDYKIYEQFFDALEEIINEDDPYSVKLGNLKAHMRDREEMLIEELISWFDNRGSE